MRRTREYDMISMPTVGIVCQEDILHEGHRETHPRDRRRDLRDHRIRRRLHSRQLKVMHTQERNRQTRQSAVQVQVQGSRGSGSVPRKRSTGPAAQSCSDTGPALRSAGSGGCTKRNSARRCRQVGMHWRHENAARVCAIIARLRSMA